MHLIDSITIAWCGSPGSSSAQHQGDAVSCEYSGQPGEITVSVCSLLKNLFIYLSLFNTTTTSITNTRVTKNICSVNQQKVKHVYFSFTSLEGLLREKTLRGHFRWRCPEHQLRMFSHSTVLEGPGPSSRCNRTNCFRARTAVFSNICSNWEGKNMGESKQNLLPLSLNLNSVWIIHVWSYSISNTNLWPLGVRIFG